MRTQILETRDEIVTGPDGKRWVTRIIKCGECGDVAERMSWIVEGSAFNRYTCDACGYSELIPPAKGTVCQRLS